MMIIWFCSQVRGWKVQMARGGVNSLFKISTNFTKQVSFLVRKHSRDFSKIPTGAIENIHLFFLKSAESRLASSAGGREEPNPL